MRTPEGSRSLVERMAGANLPRQVIDDFVVRCQQWASGFTGKLDWPSVSPPVAGDIVDLERLHGDPVCGEHGRRILGQMVCIKLNGGLGTTMKLDGAKSLIPVREGRSFLQLIVDQLARLRAAHGSQTPLLLMSSYRTRAGCLAQLGGSVAQPAGLPVDFLQHKVPRIDVTTGAPLDLPGQEEEQWTPPGHGDVYRALWLSGLLDRLIDAGYRWAFVSNADNLAATVDPALLGHLDRERIDFAMEVTDKTAADVKGGTLVRHGGRLSLLERAQVPPSNIPDFEDLDQLPVFNTNSLWWRLEAVRSLLERGKLEMPTIVNPKRVAGREVVQLEIAMGAAIGSFERAIGVRVPRLRFAPVKGTVDLLAVRSDAYVLDELGGLRLSPERPAELGPPVVRLDPRHYQGFEELERLVPDPLSLVRCRSLCVEGPVRFGAGVVCEGEVTLLNRAERVAVIEPGTRLSTGVYEL